MDLNEYIVPLRRWWWLLVVAALVAAVASYFATRRQTPQYQSRTTLMVGRAIDNPNPTSGEFYLAQQLASSYADIANREPVRNATKQALKMTWLPGYIARVVPNSQLVEITVTDTNPQRAQAVALELAQQLIQRSPTGDQSVDQNRLNFINGQLDSLQTEITDTKNQIDNLQKQLSSMNSARQIADTQTQIGDLQTKLNTLQTNYANLLSNTGQGAANTLTVIEPAELPSSPITQNKMMTVALSAAIAMLLAAGAAYLIEYLDDTLKTSEDIERVLNHSVIGFIADMEEENVGVYVADNPRSPIAEAFRSLRTNLEFAGVDKPLKTILVTSADTGVGKTSVATNLAIIMAQGEKKVVLIDADLRRPRVHLALGIPNREGLSDVFRGRIDIQDVGRAWREGDLAVITTGSLPPNPTELLGSKKVDQFLERLGDVADVVIIDGPPFLVADAPVLASKVDGILLVVRPGHTREDAARAMMDQIKRAGARVVGVALNRIPARRAGVYGGYNLYANHYSDISYIGKSKKLKKGERGLAKFFVRFTRKTSDDLVVK